MNNEQCILLGVLEERLKANQPGLLSLFQSAGLRTDGNITVKDLYRMYLFNSDDFTAAVVLLFPECNMANASGAWLTKFGSEASKTSEYLYDGIGGYDYGLDPENFNNFDSSEGMAHISYKTILKWSAVALLVVGIIAIVYYYYNKNKR